MKRAILTLSLLAVLLLYPAARVQATAARIEGELTDNVTINADIPFPPEAATRMKIAFPDYTRHESISAASVADATFHDLDAERSENSAEDYMHLVENSAGEWTSARSYGVFSYTNGNYVQRYYDVTRYFLEGFIDPIFFMDHLVYEPGDFSAEHDYMTMAEADALARDKIAEILGRDHTHPDLVLKEKYAATHEQLSEIMDALANDSPGFRAMLEIDKATIYSGWNQADDVYILLYSFEVDGIEVLNYAGAESIVIYDEDAPTIHTFYADVRINREGIYQMDVQIFDIVDEPGATVQPLLNPEQAVAALAAYMDNLIFPTPVEITGAYLQYFPVSPAGASDSTILEPVWCFTADLIYDSKRYTNWRTYRISAITGEFII